MALRRVRTMAMGRFVEDYNDLRMVVSMWAVRNPGVPKPQFGTRRKTIEQITQPSPILNLLPQSVSLFPVVISILEHS
jgi:hypothetical protein